MLSGLLFVLCLISAILLIIMIYIQDDQGEGMGGIFAGSSGSPFGGRGSNVLQKITATLVFMFFVSSFAFAYVNKKPKLIEDTTDAGSWVNTELGIDTTAPVTPVE